MADLTQRETFGLFSDAAVQVNGHTFRTEGYPVELHVNMAPSDVVGLEVSNGAYNWDPCSDVDGVAITAVGVGFYISRERGEFMRVVTAADKQGPGLYRAVLVVHKEGG